MYIYRQASKISSSHHSFVSQHEPLGFWRQGPPAKRSSVADRWDLIPTGDGYQQRMAGQRLVSTWIVAQEAYTAMVTTWPWVNINLPMIGDSNQQ